MKLKLKDIIILSLMGALMAASDFVFDFLPNVHLVGVSQMGVAFGICLCFYTGTYRRFCFVVDSVSLYMGFSLGCGYAVT